MDAMRVRDALEPERQRILQMALSEASPHASQAEVVSRLTEDYVRRCGGSVAGHYVLERRGRIAAVAAALDLPGGVCLLMLPAWAATAVPRDALSDLLAYAATGADRRGRRFIQTLMPPPLSLAVEPALRGAGYCLLANLRYMQRPAFDPVAIEPRSDVTWQTVSEAGDQAFADAIRRTYIDSQDCPLLTGVRSMQEVLAGHRSTGEYDPEGWFLLRRGGEAVAVVLTARTPFRHALELVYTGVAAEARGHGLGRLCVHRAIVRARDLAMPHVTLAMDAANAPALRLYTSMGFSETGTKDAWVRIFRRADHEAAFSLPSR